ncbi:1,4-alpha-glucan branching protein GlgB [bacterium C-53]|nr:1,4-alpha-glucan branching protein GlgB [Lachnospiraceae bacterium]NBI01946.1 1,4-alpha-glucan branching protein GlgB [Lachnospiraceae bacterium]RKJ12346.1 1,4-alpha-glucan branching protein GlgB [bacterium C-53]
MDKKLYDLMDWAEIEAVIYSEEDQPKGILGAHTVKGGTLVQTFQPGAEKVFLKTNKTQKEMDRVDDEGFFAVLVKNKVPFTYTYIVEDAKGRQTEKEDPYRYPGVITEKDTKKFNAGIHYRAYEVLGAHLTKIDGTDGVHFAVWAPNAVRVSVVGDFNNWDGRIHQMQRLWDSGIFELFIPDIEQGAFYKFEIKARSGETFLKADPYGYGAELRPNTASVVRDIYKFKWNDDEFMAARGELHKEENPMFVYELHLGSFHKPSDGRDFYNYREIAPLLCKYVKEMGYTHVELMPVMEHPFDASWGYQVIGYYAPTSRYGTPEDFMYFMNYMHNHGIGVILDWVPAHFPRDIQGLSNFDGTCLYEHRDPRQGCHPHWGTLIYNYGRPEVVNYLIANALYWAREYHVDGIRMDAVASMLYLDYGKNDGEWVANIYGGKENLESLEFLKHLNSIFKKEFPDALLIAEESTAWPLVTGALKDGGLGFDYKWNMGWMNDFLGYMQYDPLFRTHHYNELCFSMIYAYSEKFMLTLSHDEVVHGKATLVGKMPGTMEEKYANLRAAYGFFMTHPGKKLLFMGQDIAEFDEWNEERSVEWELLEYEEHKQMQKYVKALVKLYRTVPALHKMDHVPEGFEWINDISANENIVVYLRKTDKEEETLLIVCNFENIPRNNYKIGVPCPCKLKEIFNSDSEDFGGFGFRNSRMTSSKKDECDARENSVRIKVPPLGISVFQVIPLADEEEKPVQAPKKPSTARKTKTTAKK